MYLRKFLTVENILVSENKLGTQDHDSASSVWTTLALTESQISNVIRVQVLRTLGLETGQTRTCDT